MLVISKLIYMFLLYPNKYNVLLDRGIDKGVNMQE